MAPAAVALAAALGGGCSVGVGEGEVTGTLSAPECGGFEGPELDLKPDFFAADPVEDILEIRVQKGSDFEDASDGIAVTVLDAAAVKDQLAGTEEGAGVSFDLGAPEEERLVNMSLYMNETCPFKEDRESVVYEARSGSITFLSIYAPKSEHSGVEIWAELSGVRLDDASRPEERYATIDGYFRFLFNRGRPAQRFP